MSTTYILGVMTLAGALQTAPAADEAACLRAARAVAQTAYAAGVSQIACIEVAQRQGNSWPVWTGRPVQIVWQRPHAVAVQPTGPQCDAFAALADPQRCQPYEQQRIDIERTRVHRLQIEVLP
ncbi:hypothetical protein ACOTJR_27975 [Achromobacter xylosoxidans]